MNTPRERDWTDAFTSNDAAAREAATPELREYIRGTLARGFGRQFSDSDLEDLTQESLVRIHDKLDSFKGRSRFTTWAASVAVHQALSELRRRRYRHVSLEAAVQAGEAMLQSDATDRIARSERDELLQTAMREALTERQREALFAELGGLPLLEVARRLGSSRGAVYKLLHDARKRLLRHFEQHGLDANDLLLGEGDAP